MVVEDGEGRPVSGRSSPDCDGCLDLGNGFSGARQCDCACGDTKGTAGVVQAFADAAHGAGLGVINVWISAMATPSGPIIRRASRSTLRMPRRWARTTSTRPAFGRLAAAAVPAFKLSNRGAICRKLYPDRAASLLRNITGRKARVGGVANGGIAGEDGGQSRGHTGAPMGEDAESAVFPDRPIWPSGVPALEFWPCRTVTERGLRGQYWVSQHSAWVIISALLNSALVMSGALLTITAIPSRCAKRLPGSAAIIGTPVSSTLQSTVKIQVKGPRLRRGR